MCPLSEMVFYLFLNAIRRSDLNMKCFTWPELKQAWQIAFLWDENIIIFNNIILFVCFQNNLRYVSL